MLTERNLYIYLVIHVAKLHRPLREGSAAHTEKGCGGSTHSSIEVIEEDLLLSSHCAVPRV